MTLLPRLFVGYPPLLSRLFGSNAPDLGTLLTRRKGKWKRLRTGIAKGDCVRVCPVAVFRIETLPHEISIAEGRRDTSEYYAYRSHEPTAQAAES